MKDGLSISELSLGYNEFLSLLDGNAFPDYIKHWISEWNRIDLAMSPMDDNERRLMRVGHYIGYFIGKIGA